MTNKAIKWVRQQKALMPDKPFFMYFAPGACHAPHHVPKEWIDKYKGKFDQGWDKLREEIFARQKELGVIPRDAELTERPEEIPAWDADAEGAEADPRPANGDLCGVPRAHRPPRGTAGRCAQGPGGTRRHAGHLHHRRQRRLGRRDAERQLQRDGDAERHVGSRNGRVPEEQDRRFRRTERLQPLCGRLGACDGHPLSMDQASRIALGRHAQRHDRALAERASKPRERSVRSSVTSSMSRRRSWKRPGLPHPTIVNSVQQAPMEGFSMLYAFDDAKAADRHETQYFEMFCNRGIYHKGWTAVTRHSTPWDMSKPLPAFDDDVWELYDTNKDWTQARNIAKDNPQKLHELQQALADRGRQVQRSSARRSEGSNASTRTWPAGLSSSRARRRSCSAAWVA